jgi:hypothetical protein
MWSKSAARRAVGPKWMGVWVLVAMVTAAVGRLAADQRFLVPEQDPGGPFYARIELGLVHHTDDWAAIAFYRDPSCVPDTFNLLRFFDPNVPRAFGCPLTVHGFVIYETVAPGAAPIQAKLEANDGVTVTVIFVPWDALAAAIADNRLFMPELLALPHLVGNASLFEETLHPTGGSQQNMLQLNAFGTLDDGRSFEYQVTEVKGDLVHVRISFQ